MNEQTPAPLEIWTPVRLRIRRWFDQNHAELGALYVGAIEMLYAIPIQGRERFVAHAGREIANRLPDVICEEVPEPQRTTHARNLTALQRLWGKEILTDSDLEQQTVEVSGALARCLSQLLLDHFAGSNTAADIARRLFAAVAPENRTHAELAPIVERWAKTSKWFTEKAHVPSKVAKAANADFQEIRSTFEQFEGMLRALIDNFYSTVSALDEILEETNARSD